ncbi:MAG: anhydro-N-acetylmuramic acid kinase [Planctomycetota bacterium]|nr:anhydro-N-acetylmuramic acid kinase [Planctomycetota bacterium]
MRALVELERRLAAGEAVVAGVLSGTSADGIDVALTRFRPTDRDAQDVPPPELLAFRTFPFPSGLGTRVRAVLDGKPPGSRGSYGPRAIALLSRDLGRAFGSAARRLANAEGLRLDLVGSHGQTVWHHDGDEPSGAATLQLGDADFTAEEAGCAVVGDFRQRDIAAGGEGAPLSALVDGLLFRELARPLAVLNLGGMGNLTLLDEPRLLAFDTGPVASLLDGLARRFLGRPLDENGRAAARGTVHEPLVMELLDHPFFDREPPRSTGRDTFGEAWIDEVVQRARDLGVLGDGGPADLLRTATAFVGATIGRALERFATASTPRLIVAGGGVHNPVLMEEIARRAAVETAASSEAGVDPDAREALVFAVLAARAIRGLPSTRRAATGAADGRILGRIAPAP